VAKRAVDRRFPFGVEVPVAFLGCVHGDVAGLRRVLQDVDRRGIQRAFHLGDLLGERADSTRQVLELLVARGIDGVAGHVEQTLGIRAELGELPGGLQTYIESLPALLRLRFGAWKLLLCHGSPRRPTEGLGVDTRDHHLSRLGRRSGADIMVTAHTHRACRRSVGSRLFVNVGSVKVERDRSSYAVLYLGPRTPRVDTVHLPGS
jgi:predicted phosphodiesterase